MLGRKSKFESCCIWKHIINKQVLVVTKFATPTAKTKLTINDKDMEANAAASSNGIASPDKRLEGSIATAREESNTSLTTVLAAINEDWVLGQIRWHPLHDGKCNEDITYCWERLTQVEMRIMSL